MTQTATELLAQQSEHSTRLLSEITSWSKYSKFLPALGRRETWFETVQRNAEMHAKKYPHLSAEIYDVYVKYVLTKKVLPSMRSLQFAGRPIDVAPNRIFNCAYAPADHPKIFSEVMFLLLGGTGMGFSVQKHHTEQLPEVHLNSNDRPQRFLIDDSIQGWANAVDRLCATYFYGKPKALFDFRDIRPKGALLITTGGKAPGPEPLKVCLETLERKFEAAIGRKLGTLEVHDILCIIADAVLAGGIRRAAMISLFDRDDEAMLTCKSGAWWEVAPYRARANNSAVLPRGQVTEEEFKSIWKKVEDSGAGEPGVYWTNNVDWGTNPCCEIGLRPYQFCNLCEVNAGTVTSQEDLNQRCRAAAFLGTLQAGFTDFHYLREVWRETTEQDALIGVGMTGIGSGAVLDLDLTEAAEIVKRENERVSGLIGINMAARCTTVKPSGTSSLVVGSSSGIHAWHNDYYIRRIRFGKNESIAQYLQEKLPELVEQDKFNPVGVVASFPQKAPENAILRTESAMDLLERVRKFNVEWVREGHRDGDNTHNVSCTISLKQEDWVDVGNWMWENRNTYNGISVLPYDGGTYVQAPFEDVTKEKYEELLPFLTAIDLSEIHEQADNTAFTAEIACAGGACEINL